jgi:hypothetical protein
MHTVATVVYDTVNPLELAVATSAYAAREVVDNAKSHISGERKLSHGV